MSKAEPDSWWWPADEIDMILSEVWHSALDAARNDEQQEEIHDCSVCGFNHGFLDESKYVPVQKATLTHLRRKLDALLKRRYGSHEKL